MSGMSRVEYYESSRTVLRPTLPLNQMVMCDALNLPTQLDQFGTNLIHIDRSVRGVIYFYPHVC